MNERIRRIIAENLYANAYSFENKMDAYCEWIIDRVCTNVSTDKTYVRENVRESYAQGDER